MTTRAEHLIAAGGEGTKSTPAAPLEDTIPWDLFDQDSEVIITICPATEEESR